MAEDADGQKTDDAKDTGERLFTEAEVNTITQKRVGAAREQARLERISGFTAADREELETLRKDQQERARKEAESKGNYEHALQTVRDDLTKKLQTEQQTRDKVLTELRAERIDKSLLASAAKGNTIKADHVVALLRPRLTLNDDHQVVVLREDLKGPDVGKSGDPMTVDELVQNFLDANPHLVRPAQAAGGGGSRGGASTSEAGAKPGSPEVQRLRAELDAATKEAEAAGAAMNSRQLAKVQQLSIALQKAEMAAKAA